MLSAYGHASCAGILLRGDRASNLHVLDTWLDYLDLRYLFPAVAAKVQYVPPAKPAIDKASLDSKWSLSTPVKVLFCGRDFESKNGHMALRIMRRVREIFGDIEFTYVGRLPSSVAKIEPELVTNIRQFHKLQRSEVLALMEESHLLIHPSKIETIGISLVEAAAAGMAVVTFAGPGMEYSERIFGAQGAFLVPNNQASPDESEDAFEAAVIGAMTERAVMESMGRWNHERSRSGPFSISERNRIISTVYLEALSHDGIGLSLDQLELHRELVATRFTAEALSELETRFMKKAGVGSSRFVI